MGKHIPVVEEGWAFECIEGDCEHEAPEECVVPVVACAGCLERAQSGAAADDMSDGMFDIPEWPCIWATHYGEPMMSDLKARLLREWAEGRVTIPNHAIRGRQGAPDTEIVGPEGSV